MRHADCSDWYRKPERDLQPDAPDHSERRMDQRVLCEPADAAGRPDSGCHVLERLLRGFLQRPTNHQWYKVANAIHVAIYHHQQYSHLRLSEWSRPRGLPTAGEPAHLPQ